ncbi:hypothetical protein QC760_010531 [Botrytis cinerea]
MLIDDDVVPNSAMNIALYLRIIAKVIMGTTVSMQTGLGISNTRDSNDNRTLSTELSQSSMSGLSNIDLFDKEASVNEGCSSNVIEIDDSSQNLFSISRSPSSQPSTTTPGRSMTTPCQDTRILEQSSSSPFTQFHEGNDEAVMSGIGESLEPSLRESSNAPHTMNIANLESPHSTRNVTYVQKKGSYLLVPPGNQQSLAGYFHTLLRRNKGARASDCLSRRQNLIWHLARFPTCH